MDTNPDNWRERLQDAMARRQPRYFRASHGSAKGKTGSEDTRKFAENLMVLQECAVLLGEKLGMNAVSWAVSCEGEETAAFCFDPASSAQEPEVVGALVNRRVPVSEMVAMLRANAEGDKEGSRS